MRSSLECRRRAQRALDLSSSLLDLANGEREECEHDGCLLLDGILRDCALQIRRIATVRLVELASADGAGDGSQPRDGDWDMSLDQQAAMGLIAPTVTVSEDQGGKR